MQCAVYHGYPGQNVFECTVYTILYCNHMHTPLMGGRVCLPFGRSGMSLNTPSSSSSMTGGGVGERESSSPLAPVRGGQAELVCGSGVRGSVCAREKTS